MAFLFYSCVFPSILLPTKSIFQRAFEMNFCCYCCSVAKLSLTLCDPTDCIMPGSSILHYLLELVQIHVIELVMLSNHLILCYLLLLLPSIFPTYQFGLLLSMVASMQLTAYIPEGFRRNASRDQVGVQAPSAASSAPGLQAVARGRVPAWGTR